MRHRLLTGTLLLGFGLTCATGCAGGQPAVSPLAGNPLASSAPGNPLASSSPGVPDSSLAGIHACQLVAANVVAQVLGALLERPYETSDGLECFYNTAAPGGGGPSYILTVTKRSGFEAAKSFAEGVAQSGAGRVAFGHDLGDDTFSITTDSGGPDYSLWAAKGGVSVEVDVDDIGQGVARAHDLVAAALNRL
jgi:hypothetical protein